MDSSYEIAPDEIEILIVEDSPTIRENLIETLQELAQVDAVGTADNEHEGREWLAQNDAYCGAS